MDNQSKDVQSIEKRSTCRILNEIMKIFSDMDIHELVEVTLPRKGFLKYDKFIAFLQKHLRAKRIEDLTHPMLIAATDFDHGKSVIFDHGDLAVRIAASCSIPIVFSPIEIDGINYVDGGVLRNLRSKRDALATREIFAQHYCHRRAGIQLSCMRQRFSRPRLMRYPDRASGCGRL